MDELGRQFLHMIFGGLLLLYAVFAGREQTTLVLWVVLFFGLMLVQIKLYKMRVPFVDFLLAKFGRSKEKIPARGTLAYAAGCLFVLSAIEFSFALGVIAILAFGDGLATMVGLSGKKKLPFPFNQKKTFEGFFAFLIAGTAASMFFFGPENAFVYSLVFAIVEAIDFNIDDNLLIPFFGVLLKTILK